MLSLIEKAQEAFDDEKALELEKKMLTQQFTLNDFLDQMQQIKKMGPLNQILGMIPGLNTNALKNVDIDEKKMVHIEAIIQSMTKKERQDPSIINGSRRKRIARGSGTTVQQVNRLLKDFENMKKMFKSMSEMTKRSKRGKKGFGKFRMPF